MLSARFLAVLVAVFGVVALAHKGAHNDEPSEQVYPAHLTEYSLEGYTAMMYGNGTIAAPDSIKCDICKWAMGKAYSIGCSAAGSWISGACLDFAPACEAALKILCDICSSHCDVPTIIDKACTDVHLC